MGKSDSPKRPAPGPKNAFAELMKSAASTSKRAGGPQRGTDKRERPPPHSWSAALKPYCQHPETFSKDEVFDYDAEFVTIYDKYAKAARHLLVMPRKEVAGLKSLTHESIPMLKQLIHKGEHIVASMKLDVPHLQFRTGFHAVPSMKQLHMHVISQDFVSPALKNKRHWNSFTTPFFRDAGSVLEMLQTTGEIELDPHEYEKYLKTPLRCNSCGKELANMPKLKEHLLTHSQQT